MLETKISKFPKGFLWGAATAAYQVEGGIENNDWAAAGRAGRVPAAGLACDHFRLWREDLEIAKNLSHNAHRLSLEWGRIEPRKGEWDSAALHHYHEVLSWLRDNQIKTFVTLHHFTNPSWVAAQGGWSNRKTIDDFAEFTSKVCQTLGHLVDFWITVNEPGIYAGMGYVRGKFPPFQKNIARAFFVYRNMLAAHNRAYEVIHAYYSEARVGFAQNITYFETGLTRFMRWFQVDCPYSRTKNDFFGVNHYFYRGAKKFPFTDRDSWPIYPPALFHVLTGLTRFGKPIYITENGLADAADTKRRGYIGGYLAATREAIAAGCDVRGYLHWSLLDNFEWEDGYKWKFGLVEVNFKTQKRTIRGSAKYYAEICRTNSLIPN